MTNGEIAKREQSRIRKANPDWIVKSNPMALTTITIDNKRAYLLSFTHMQRLPDKPGEELLEILAANIFYRKGKKWLEKKYE